VVPIANGDVFHVPNSAGTARSSSLTLDQSDGMRSRTTFR
jgi:hypothetical protein